MAASIAQEFYKVREEWARVDTLKSWRLAVWVAQYQDIDIIDKFLETERLPIGVFDDIFFRFETEFKGDLQTFERELWEEYAAWFETPASHKKYDMLLALKNDGLLNPDFTPRIQPESGFENLLAEMLRLKANTRGLDKVHFCLYFPPARPDANFLGGWLKLKLQKDLPSEIRLVTIDFAAARTIHINEQKLQPLLVEITPHLDMMAAINNEMDKGGGSSDTVGVDNRFRKQIRVVMETTLKKNVSLTSGEVKKMLLLSRQMGNAASVIAALLVAAQAHYNIKDFEQSELYVDDGIKKAEKEMQKGDPAGYHTWKSCIMLKGALLAAKRKWEKSIVLYEQMAEMATQHGDTFFIMEGYRISGHLYYLRGRLQQALESSLLAVVAGSHLSRKMIRESTFLHAAYLALFIARKTKTKEEVNILESQLEDWIGEDWRKLLDEGGLEKSIAQPKGKLAMSLSFTK